jgi:hypothetical protein
MKATAFIPRRWLLALTVSLAATCSGIHGRAQTLTQTLPLRPGWNAIWLEVDPADPGPGQVFAGLPVSSVWTWAERVTSAEFIEDVSEGSFGRAAWLGWYPPSRPESVLGNLHAIQGNRAYLIHVQGASVVTLRVAGRPALRSLAWAPDAFNLRGFNVDPARPPSFVDFFRGSKAHYDAAAAPGERMRIYRLGAAGQWTLVGEGAGESMQRGEACWVFCRGGSSYAGPMEVRPQIGDGLDFGEQLDSLNLTLRNCTGAPLTLSIDDLALAGTRALAYGVFDAAEGMTWPKLLAPVQLAIPAESERQLRIALRRPDFAADTHETVVAVRDGSGTLVWVPVTAKLGARSLAGLWVGSATLDAVSEANSGVLATNELTGEVTREDQNLAPTPVRSAFNLRLLIHVDTAGRARLLKEVIQMWREGTYTNDAGGSRVVDKPGGYVLVTDPRLIPQFQGATLRDGVAVGRRLSSVGFDFDGSHTNAVALSGVFATNQTLRGTLLVGPDLPTNPFRHKYHPDHDDLDANFDRITNAVAREVYAVAREIELQVSPQDPAGANPPDYGSTQLAGTYRETLTGLHKRPIAVAGKFRLRRVSQIDTLNPSPVPD